MLSRAETFRKCIKIDNCEEPRHGQEVGVVDVSDQNMTVTSATRCL